MKKTWSVTKQKTCFLCIFKPLDFISSEKTEPIFLPETYIQVYSILRAY